MFPTSLLALLVGQIPGCRQILRSFNSSSLPPPGVVRVSLADMDRETRENYSVVIQAKDMGGQLGGLAGTTTVNITLSDINDNPPMFDQSKCRDSPMMLHLLIHRPYPFFLSPLPLPLTPPPLQLREHTTNMASTPCAHTGLCVGGICGTHTVRPSALHPLYTSGPAVLGHSPPGLLLLLLLTHQSPHAVSLIIPISAPLITTFQRSGVVELSAVISSLSTGGFAPRQRKTTRRHRPPPSQVPHQLEPSLQWNFDRS